MTYLLPCPCGRTIPVEPRQAGEPLTCACGRSTPALTWREITALAQSEAPPAPERPRSKWGASQRLALVGGILFLAGAVMAVVVYATWPHNPVRPLTPDEIHARFEKMAPLESVRYFRAMVAWGLADDPKQRIEQAYEAEVVRDHAWMAVSLVVAALGAALLATGVILAWRAKRSPRVAAAADSSGVAEDV